MHILKKIQSFYIKSSIHVALSVVSLVGVWSLEYGIDLTIYFYGLVFFSTISGYNFVKYASAAGLHHRSLTNSLRTIQVFSVISLLLLLYCVFYIASATLGVGLAFGCLTFLYAIPFIKNKSLRTISGFKVVTVALVWAGVTSLLPVIESQLSFSADYWFTFLQYFLVVLGLMIPFEIRDLQFDQLALGTMPQKWGLRKTKLFGVLLLLITLLLEGFKDVLSTRHILALLLTCFLIGVAIVVSRKKQSEYFAAFWVESIPMVYLFLMFLFGHFLQ